MSLLAICCFSRFASLCFSSFFFFFNDTATTEIYTLSLHDALPIFVAQPLLVVGRALRIGVVQVGAELRQRAVGDVEPQLLLGLHQREPEAPPQPDAPALAPQRLHRRGGVAGPERRRVRQTAAFARATSLLQSARNCCSPRSVSGCSSSFFNTSGGRVATSAPIMAASTTWRGCRIEAARISVASW